MASKALAIVGTAAYLACGCFGQELRNLGLSFRIGSFMPSTGFAREEGKSWTHVGAEINFGRLRAGAGGARATNRLALSVDSHLKGDLGATPVLLNYVVEQEDLFVSVGFGASANRELRVSGSERNTRRKVRSAYQFGIGWVFKGGPTRLFAELKYFGNGFDDLNGFAICVGARL